MATIGLNDESSRIEISKNYWDELGCGEKDLCHSTWAEKFATALGLRNDLSWSEEFTSYPEECIEFFVVSQNLASRKYNWLYLIGHLGTTETIDPVLNVRIVEIGKKLGFSESDLEYFTQHIKVDAIHSADWMSKVVIPVCQEDPEHRLEIAIGAELHLKYLYKCHDAILAKIKLAKSNQATL